MMCGGVNEEKPADREIQEIIEKVKDEASKKSGKDFDQFVAVSYRSQVVAGTNHFVKVDVGNGDFVHLRIFVPLPNENSPPSLAGIQLGKSKSDPIEYF